ncbi:AMP-binding protein [Basilea psittacipulmonis]|uniref:AMP-dependent synthetase/ligase domain-containing protein n=1 Tax=Basilea psittacipulmonis DSM 24701 TaxID=1072685 RepID=A0A077DJM6_9BURK|nr:AMP-binding protein [Basilea psittacipulmonis]AIL33263.1 hypothetical protein IX83_08100 [Basilea psittacipulmonis DSM 24701]
MSHLLYPSFHLEHFERSNPQFLNGLLLLSQKLSSYTKVALWCHDSHLFTQALLAAWHAGCEVLLLPNLSESSIQWSHTADCLLSDQIIESTIPIIHLPFSDNETACLHSSSDNPSQATPTQSLSASATALLKPLSPDASLYLRTSGSSGESKIIKKTLRQFESEFHAINDVLSIQKHHYLLASVSHQHLFGLSFKVMMSLFTGADCVPQQLTYPEFLVEQTHLKKRSCIWISSPSCLNHFEAFTGWETLKPSIDLIISSGGPLPPKTANLFKENLMPIQEIYGSTETGVIATRQSDQAWQPFHSVHIDTSSSDQTVIQSNWTDQAQAIGDRIHLKENGQFTLNGRMDRVIKLAEKRASLDEIEHIINTHSFVKETFVFPHSQQTRLVAVIALTQDGIQLLRDSGRQSVVTHLRDFLNEKLDPVFVPRFWRFTTELPKNTQSKLDKDALHRFIHKPKQVEWDEEIHHENTYTAIGKIPLDLHYFSGHFAQFPLVPGVVQLEWAIEAAKHFGYTYQIDRIVNLKYQQFLRPHDTIKLSMTHQPDKKQIQFTIQSVDLPESVTYSSGRVHYRDSHE